MLEPLIIPPGLAREGSKNAAQGRWYDGNNVRFHKDHALTIGGALPFVGTSLGEPLRGIHGWTALDGTLYFALATPSKLWLYSNEELFDITPFRVQTTPTDPFETTNGSPDVVVSDTAHGAATGDTVIISGADPVGGITVDGAYIVDRIDEDSYIITHSAPATSDATGGGSVVIDYEIVAGNDNSGGATPWSSGGYSSGGYSGISVITTQITTARVWSLDSWGEDLIATYPGGAIYHWDSSAGPTARAAALSGSPVVVGGAYVSSTDRHIFALGAEYDGDFDPMMLRWATQESLTSWTPTATNTADARRLEKGTKLLAAVGVRSGILIFSDTAVYLARYIGAPYAYEITSVADDCGLIGPAAVCVRDGKAYWMGPKGFYMYDGAVNDLPCDILEYITSRINLVQGAKFVAGYDKLFDEIKFFCATNGNDEIDGYFSAGFANSRVSWSKGDVARTAWFNEGGVTNYPIAGDASGTVFYHEVGITMNGEAIDAWIESADIQIASGDQIMHVKRFFPDFRSISGSVTVTLTGRNYPQAVETRVKSAVVTGSTVKKSLRNRGRYMNVKMACNDEESAFRLGQFYADVVAHGGR